MNINLLIDGLPTHTRLLECYSRRRLSSRACKSASASLTPTATGCFAGAAVEAAKEPVA